MKKVLFSIGLGLICHLLVSQDLSDDFLYRRDSLRNELQASNDVSERLEILRQLSISYQFIDMDSAIFYGQQFIDAAERYDDKNRLMDALALTGQAYIHKGDLPKALELSLKAVEINQDNPELVYTDSIPGVGPAYYNLSDIYFLIGDDKKAMEYADRQIDNGTSKIGSGFGHYQKARVFERANQLDSAIRHLELSLKIFELAVEEVSFISNKYDLSPESYNLLAKVYLKLGKPDMALAEFKNILKLNILEGELLSTSNTYNDLAQFFASQNSPDSSIYYAWKGLMEAEKVDYVKGKLDAYSMLAHGYESKDAAHALYYYKLATSTRNSLYGAGNIQVLKDMIAESEKKREEVAAAKIEYKNQLKMNAFIGITFTLLVVALFLYRNSRQKQKAKQKVEEAYDQLKATQAQLIQSEKMASLGELTAGIAHEIQNPLNFVNNFSEVNRELIAELKEEIEKGDLEEVKLIATDIEANEEKINQHGKRADAIVKGMLEHSKKGSGQKELTDLNTLADEFLRLSYQSFLAKEPEFQCELKTNLDPDLPKVSVIPQDIGKVLLNLMNNAFYACAERSRSAVNEKANSGNVAPDYKPTIQVSTRQLPPEGGKGGYIEISVSDNGPGIPDSIKEKIFQPFFTTKPTGSGTGLGLSLSYDIVKAHGGQLKVVTKANEGSEFIIILITI